MKLLIERLECFLEIGGFKKNITFLVISGIALIISIFGLLPLPFDEAWIAIILCGVPIILEAIIGLITTFDIKADVLVSLALIASICIGEDFAAGEVAFIMQLGALLEFGTFEMEATKVGEDSSIQRMIRLVQSADTGKAKIVNWADRQATWIVIIALAAATLTWIFSGQITKSVTILVVFCPCALVLATPTAIIAAIGNSTKHGFLVREGGALERLATVKKIVFDKTGTLTYGTPKVIAVKSLSEQFSENDIYAYTAAAEQFSEHPLGKAIVACYKQDYKETLMPTFDFQMLPGRGVFATVENKAIFAGNAEMFAEHSITIDQNTDIENFLKQGCTVTYIALNGTLAGCIALSDTIRMESVQMLDTLEKAGTPAVLLTGDNENAAQTIANQLHIKEVHANCLPEDKLQYIDNYQKAGNQVCMIGDGINDAPALKKADVGIAMGGIGSDITVDAADIALVDDELKELPHLISLSKRMMATIKLNLTFSMGLNFLAIVLAITGVLNPVVGALVHNAGSVLVIINSAFLLNWRKKNDKES